MTFLPPQIAIGPDLFTPASTQSGLNKALNPKKDLPPEGIIDTGVFGKAVANNLQSVFQKGTTNLLGGEVQQSSIRQQIGQLQSIGQQFGVDVPFVRNILNSISQYTGITLSGVPSKILPNILLTTSVGGKVYSFYMYEGEEDVEFTDTVNWSETEIIGRSSAVFNFKNSMATVFSLTGYLTVESKDGINFWKTNMQNLKAMRFPANNGIGVMSPPIWSLTMWNPYNLVPIISAVPVRINSTTYTFMKPYVEDGVPSVTKITLNMTQVEDTLVNSQVSYKDFLLGSDTSQRYFANIASVGDSVADNSNPAVDILRSISNPIIDSFTL